MVLYRRVYSTIMLIKDKFMNMITAHPKIVTLGIGLGIIFVIGTAIGMVYHNQQVFAISQQNNAENCSC
jgi:hypothetical protein